MAECHTHECHRSSPHARAHGAGCRCAQATHPGGWKTLLKCPAPVLLKDGAWSYRFRATANSTTAEVLLTGAGDPGYHFTAAGLAETALCLSGRTAACGTAGAGAGVVTAMVALDPHVVLQRLSAVGLVTAATTTTTNNNNNNNTANGAGHGGASVGGGGGAGAVSVAPPVAAGAGYEAARRTIAKLRARAANSDATGV